MATAPQIYTRSGNHTAQNVVFTTNQETLFIEGIVGETTVDVQVSVNGSNFVSDPTLMFLDGQSFTVPNPSSYPDGLVLELGENTVQLRAIDVVGSVSPISTVSITRVPAIEGSENLIPTGVRLRRRRNAVDILAVRPVITLTEGVAPTYEFKGLNFYASSSPGGTSGYFKINSKLVTDTSTVFEEDLLDIDEHTMIFQGTDSVRVRVTQQGISGEEIGAILDRVINTKQFSGDLKFMSSLQSRALTEFVSFRHNRIGGNNSSNQDQFIDVDDSDSLYYAVTAVYYNPATESEFETPYSQEVVGKPLIIDTSIRDLPGRSQIQIVQDFIQAVQRVDSEISLIPGSTTRDVTIDPFASEVERIWFIVDFVHRSQSFLTLIQIDDANGDGISDPVSSSAYKQALKAALGLSTDNSVQQLIDTQFDKLAGNLQKPRLPGRPAVGRAVLYTATRPVKDITIASGTVVSTDSDASNNLPAARYIVGGTYLLALEDIDAYFNFETQQYEIVVDVVAENAGSSGNRPAGAVKNVASPVGGLQVTNRESIVFGRDRESNAELAERAQLALVSVDSGTEGGYTDTATGFNGVIKSKIIKCSDPLMMRDYDGVRKKHIGGKVDIWVQGLKERTVTERFAFTFNIVRDIRCQILDPVNLIFRVLDSNITINTPVVEVLDNPSSGLGVRNVSKGQDYDLTGVFIVDYQTFRLNTGIAQPVTNIDDVVTSDVRYRSVNQYTFGLQPVRRVTSVVGEVSGALDSTLGFGLYKTDDPLLDGESTIAKDYLIINQVNGVPAGATITINDERHVMIGFFEERLTSIGVNTATIRVFSSDRTIEYEGPSSLTPDYEIIQGSGTTPARLVRTVSSSIVSGQTVSVDYEHDENFTVTYVVNDLLQQLQRVIDKQRHITADVLVKQAVLNLVDIETTVQLKKGASKEKADPATRSGVSLELNQQGIGEGKAQSDIINVVDSTNGVDFQVLPLARMGYADGSRKVRESVLPTAVRVPSLDIGGNQVFLLTNPVKFPTTDGGGLVTEHRGIFQDDETLTLSEDLISVGQRSNQAFIIGALGAVIPGYSDNATLTTEGFLRPETILAERLRRTANHVVVSLSGAGIPQDQPENHLYAASYVVRGDVGPHDIPASQVEFLGLGKLALTFRASE